MDRDALAERLYPALAESLLNEFENRVPSEQRDVMGGLLSEVLREEGRRRRQPAMSAASLIPLFALDDQQGYSLGRLRRGAMDTARTLKQNGAHWAHVLMFVKCAHAFARAERQFVRALAEMTPTEQHMFRAAMVLGEVCPPRQFPPKGIDGDTFPYVLMHCVEASGDYDSQVLFL